MNTKEKIKAAKTEDKAWVWKTVAKVKAWKTFLAWAKAVEEAKENLK